MASVLVMNVVIVTVHGGTDGNHRFQGRGLQGGQLQSVKSSPGNSHHADIAITPRLSGNPGNDRQPIRQFPGRIFVIKGSVRLAMARDINPNSRIPCLGQNRIRRFVTVRGPIPLSIGQILQYCRDRSLCNRIRQPDSGSEPTAISEQDILIFENVKTHIAPICRL